MADLQQFSVSINFKTSNAEKAKKDVDKLKNSVDNLKKSSGSMDKASSGLSKLQSGFSKLVSIAKIAVVAKSLTNLGKSIFKLTESTSDYIETVNLFRASMGDAADEAKEFIDKAESLLGLDPSQMMNSISQFYNLAQGIGIASDRAYTMSQNLTQLAGDLSSFANISFETAQSKLMSGFSGQVKPLREYGIALDQASLQETAYSLGLDQKVKNMTRAQKTELIYYQIMKSTTKMQGDLGRSLISPANSVRVMQTEFKKLARAVGSIFIPIMMKLIPVVRAVTQVLTQAAQAIAHFFGFEMTDFNSDLSSVGNLLGGISDDIDDVGDSAEDTAKKMNKMLMPFDELNNISIDTSSASGAGAGAGVGTGGSLGIELPTYDMFSSMSESMDRTISKIKSTLATIFEPIQNSWNTHGQGVMDSFEYALSQNLRLSNDIGDSLLEVWTNGTGEETMGHIFGILEDIFNIIGNIKGAFATAWETDDTGTKTIQNLADGLNNLLGIVEGVVDVFERWTQSEDFQNFANAVMKISETMSGIFEKVTEKLQEIWDNGGSETFGKLLEVLGKFVELIGVFVEKGAPGVIRMLDVITPILEWLIKLLGAGLDSLSGILDFLIGVFSGDWERTWKGIGEVTEGFQKQTELLETGVKGVFEGIWKGAVQFWENIKNDWERRKTAFLSVVSWIDEHLIQPIKNFFENLMTNPKETIHNAIEDIKGFFKFDWEFPKIKTPHMSWSTQPAPGWIANILRAINLPAEIPKLNVSWYKDGGFPETGQLFFANEAGPELIGNIGNKTAVANQDQITTAIATAAYNAISKALAENKSSEQPTIVQVNLGNEQLYQGYGKYKNEQANMLGVDIG